MAGRYHDHEIAVAIEAETGERFRRRTVAEFRRLAGLAAVPAERLEAPAKGPASDGRLARSTPARLRG